MKSEESRQSGPDELGLCRTCRNVRVITSARGGVFYLCRLSETDPSFPKYPRLPVLRCSGYTRGSLSQPGDSQ